MAAGTNSTGHLARFGMVGALAFLLSACGSQVAIDPSLGVSPSERVAQEGEAIERGGGRAHTGRPYTIAGRTYVPRHDPDYSAEGLASWYGARFHGRKTANGEVFDRFALSAAHTTMPLPSYARVTNTENGRSVIVRVNDRGPFHGNRVIDVSRAVADTLSFRNAGVARVKVDYVGPASTEGSADSVLMATLRTDGAPAQMPINGGATSIQIASAAGTPTVDRMPLAAADRPVAPTLAFASAPPMQTETRALANAPRPPVRPATSEVVAASAPAPAAIPDARPASRIGAASPVQLVGIFFAAPDSPSHGFTREGRGGAPFANVQAQGFASLRTDR